MRFGYHNTENMTDDEIRKMRKMSVIKMAAMIGIIVAIFAFASIAWFTMNREVVGSGIGMKSSADEIEFAVDDDENANSASHSAFYNLYSKLASAFAHSSELQTGVGANGDTIYWRLEDSDMMLMPSAEGKLHFTVVSGNPHNFSLTIHGFQAETQTVTDANEEPVTDANGIIETEVTALNEITDSNANEYKKLGTTYLKEHILFFTNRSGTEESGYRYSGFIEDPSNFTLLPDENTDNAYTIYWIWPNTFGQIALTDSEVDQGYTEHALPVLSSTPEEDDRSKLLAYMKTVNDDGDYLFFDDAENKGYNYGTLLDTLDAKHTLANDSEEDEDEESINFKDEYDKLSEGYNSADQIIGRNVDYALIELTASG